MQYNVTATLNFLIPLKDCYHNFPFINNLESLTKSTVPINFIIRNLFDKSIIFVNNNGQYEFMSYNNVNKFDDNSLIFKKESENKYREKNNHNFEIYIHY